MSEAFKRCVSIQDALAELDAAGKSETPEADLLRDEGDALWHRLDAAERMELYVRAAYLEIQRLAEELKEFDKARHRQIKEQDEWRRQQTRKYNEISKKISQLKRSIRPKSALAFCYEIIEERFGEKIANEIAREASNRVHKQECNEREIQEAFYEFMNFKPDGTL